MFIQPPVCYAYLLVWTPSSLSVVIKIYVTAATTQNVVILRSDKNGRLIVLSDKMNTEINYLTYPILFQFQVNPIDGLKMSEVGGLCLLGGEDNRSVESRKVTLLIEVAELVIYSQSQHM